VPESDVDAAASSLRGIFASDLRNMLYGFGDDHSPLPETVEAVEEAVVEYIGGLTRAALAAAVVPGRINVEDLLLLLRKDPRKYARAKELLKTAEEIRGARKAFDESKLVEAAMAEGGGR